MPLIFKKNTIKIYNLFNKIINKFGYEIKISKIVNSNHHIEKNFRENYKIIENLNGFLSLEAFQLFYISKQAFRISNEAVLEIGVFCGMSLLGLATIFNKSKVTGVDPMYEDFNNSPALEGEADYLMAKSKHLSGEQRINEIIRVAEIIDEKNNFTTRHNIELKKISQEEFLKSNDNFAKFQVIHIDGEHTFKAMEEIINYFPKLLKNNSLIIIDDILNAGFPGIIEAVCTNQIYKKELFPICYGFNKGIFIYKPDTKDTMINIINYLIQFYNKNNYFIRKLHDNSFFVEK